MTDPFRQIEDLEKRLQEVCEPLGLTVHQTAFMPAPEPGMPPAMSVTFVVDRNKAFKTPEQINMEQEFEMIARREKLQSNQDKIAQARDDLLRKMGANPEDFLSVPLPTVDAPSLSSNVPSEQDDLFFERIEKGEISTFDISEDQLKQYIDWIDKKNK